MNPLISVVIPTYNWSNVLKLAIKSVLWQTYQNFEIVVIGDACTDDSEEVAKSFNDPRIKWFNLEKNSGSQSIPNNFGIEKANGEWIAHLGHDDIWHPNHLEFLLNSSSEADFRYSAGCYIGPDNEETEFKNRFVLFGLNSFKEEQEKVFHIPPGSIMYRKLVYQNIGGWKDYREIYESPDHEYILRALKFCKNKISLSKKVTFFKFNAVWRKNCYKTKPNHQQVQLIEKIEENPNFFDSKILNTAKQLNPYISNIDQAHSTLEEYFNNIMEEKAKTSFFQSFKEKGENVKKARIYRGLENSDLLTEKSEIYKSKIFRFE